MMMEKKRSVGITIFCVTFILYGINGVLNLWMAFFMSLSMLGCRTIPLIAHIVVCATPLVQSSFIIASIGILRLRNWARKLVIALSLTMIISNIPQLIPMAMMQKVTGIKETVIYCAIHMLMIVFLSYAIYFFTRPKVKEQFK